MVPADLLDRLTAIDTPTICNALEVLAPDRRTTGFNRLPLVCPFPAMKPIVGYARTATIRSRQANPVKDQRAIRIAYYEYVEKGPRPSIVLIQDLDGVERGLGAFWGEVQTNIHRALGCAGVVTDGSIRDIDQMAKGFFVLAGSIMPSHVHADRHGAAVIPAEVAAAIPETVDLLVRREKVILDACARPGFSTADIRAAFSAMSEIH